MRKEISAKNWSVASPPWYVQVMRFGSGLCDSKNYIIHN